MTHFTQKVQKNILNSAEASCAVNSIETASWIWHPDMEKNQPAVVRFSADFESTGEPLNFHISADQRFHLKLDGESIVRGPDNGDLTHWAFSTYQIKLKPGKHNLTAEVWWIGEHAPLCRMTVRGGFILKAEGSYHDKLTTGIAPWQVTHLDGYSYTRWILPCYYQAVGDQICVDGRIRGKAISKKAVVITPAKHPPLTGLFYKQWILSATPIPDQFSAMISCGSVRAVFDTVLTSAQKITAENIRHPKCSPVQKMVDGKEPLTIPSQTKFSFLCDLNDYYGAYPQLTVSGGKAAQISWGWAEALYKENLLDKENRNQVEGLFFTGITDRFIANGEPDQFFETLWWRAGRYVLITVETAEEALTIQKIRIEETRYPLEDSSRFKCDDSRITDLIKLCFRGLQMNTHENASDCPYYEQLMYVGDTRIQSLIQYVTSPDIRIVRRGIELFNWSRASGSLGLTTSRYPDVHTQWAPPFSLIWIFMVHDHLCWRGDFDFVKQQLSGTRSVLDAFSSFLNADNLIANVPFWVFADWTDDWDTGYPPGAREGKPSSIINLFYLLALEKAIELETTLGDPLMAAVYDHQRKLTADALLRDFWNAERKMMTDDGTHKYFSEHAQILTILSNSFEDAVKKPALHALLNQPGLTRASIYFSFYLFEALFKMNAIDTIRERFEPWNKLVEQGFKTPPETFTNLRSDCHAWGSHPQYQLHTGVLGIQPAEPGFRSVVIQPQNIGWKKICGTTVHPNGLIETEFHFTEKALEGKVTLPGIGGRLEWLGQTVQLNPGKNVICIKA